MSDRTTAAPDALLHFSRRLGHFQSQLAGMRGIVALQLQAHLLPVQLPAAVIGGKLLAAGLLTREAGPELPIITPAVKDDAGDDRPWCESQKLANQMLN